METVQKTMSQLQSNASATSARTSKSAAASKITSSSAYLEKGQIIRGLVTDIRENQVTLKLYDKTTLIASYPDNSELNMGEIATFKVTECTNESITLKHLLPSSLNREDMVVHKALEEADLPKTERNLSLVKCLLDNQLSINKSSIMSLLQEASLHQDVNVETLILMHKHNIPITDENALQMEHYLNHEHRLLTEIDSIGLELTNTMENMAKANDFTSLAAFSKVTTTYVTMNADAQGNPLLQISGDAAMELVDLLEPYQIDDSLKVQILNQSASVSDVMHAIAESITTASQHDAARTAEIQAAMEANPESSSEELPQMNEVDAFRNPIIYDVVDQFNQFQRDTNHLASILSTTDRNSLLASLEGLGLSPAEQSAIQSGEISANDFLQLINRLLQHASDPATRHQLTGLLGSDEYKDIFQAALTDKFTMTPDQLLKEGEPQKHYEEMYDNLKLLQTISSSGIAEKYSETLNHQTNGMKSNIDFMQTLNQMFSYIQLPMKFKNQNVHTDLYVYTNKKKLKQDPNNVNVLLHLDMDHLGPLDINITLTGGKSLNTKFYCNDPETQQVIKENILKLDQVISAKGFQYSNEILMRERDIDLVKDIMEQEVKMPSIKRYSFDIRA